MEKNIKFEDGSYISVETSPIPNKVYVSIGAKQADNLRATVINSTEISIAELKELTWDFIKPEENELVTHPVLKTEAEQPQEIEETFKEITSKKKKASTKKKSSSKKKSKK